VTFSTSSSVNRNKAEKSDRLFRSAVSAYCALVRPLRSDAARLDDLTLPLLPLVSAEGRRYAAAALSETGLQPNALTRRLAEEPLEISAPLLTRSVNLADVDLIGLIGRHGIGHARAIGRRASLNPNIARLIAALGAAAETADLEEEAPPRASGIVPETIEPLRAGQPPATDAAEEVRTQLRGMMRPSKPARPESAPAATPIDWSAASAAFPKLLSTALTGSDALFDTAIADTLDVSFAAAQMLDDDEAPGLKMALRALDLPVEQAFLIAILVYPYGFAGPETVRNFVHHYRGLDLSAAREQIAAWRQRDLDRRTALAHDWMPDETEEPANDAGTREMLRAS
jgi:uncharacterized protein (DUF2336 family)